MKTKFSILIFICMFFLGINNIFAYGISANQTVYVGSNVSVKVDVSELVGQFKISSSNENILGGSKVVWLEKEVKTFNFTANSVGTATITITPLNATDSNYNEFSESRSITINVIKKNVPGSIDVNPNYSKNNYLKSLNIEEYELDKDFDKEQLEYNVTLEPGTEKINVNAEAEDSKAKVKGTGEISVSEGINTIEIVVTAENGNEKIYKIFASVEEKDPIEIELNNEKYRVVKNKDLIGTKDGYNETTVKIKNFDIPALYNEVTNVTLIGLKDKDGNINLYSYDSSTGEYNEYKEFKFDLMQLYVMENKKSEYKKVNIKINDVDVPAYELEGLKDYYLIYATNTLTGYKGYYMYDVKENSVQRYNTFMLDKLTKEKDKYLSMILVLSSVCFLIMLFLLIEINRYNKNDE